MRLSPLGWAAVAAASVLALLFLTLVSSPAPPPTGVEHDARAAGEACEAAVLADVPDARFPFGANAAYLGEARYRLQGTVESEITGETVRRNYACVVQYRGAGEYRADSVRVWRSH